MQASGSHLRSRLLRAPSNPSLLASSAAAVATSALHSAAAGSGPLKARRRLFTISISANNMSRGKGRQDDRRELCLRAAGQCGSNGVTAGAGAVSAASKGETREACTAGPARFLRTESASWSR